MLYLSVYTSLCLDLLLCARLRVSQWRQSCKDFALISLLFFFFVFSIYAHRKSDGSL